MYFPTVLPLFLKYLTNDWITNGARCTREIKSRIVMAKAAFNKKETFCKQIGLTFKEETSEMIHFEHSFVLV
jgi:hypothetical protein